MLSFRITFFCVVFVCTACTPVSKTEELPITPIEVRGVLHSKTLNPSLPGTHELITEDSTVYTVESSKVVLRHFEEKDIILEGTVRRDNRLKSVILNVTAVKKVFNDGPKVVNLQNFGMVLTVPETFTVTQSNEKILLYAYDLTKPIVTIEDSKLAFLPKGEAVLVNNQRAILLHSTEDVLEKTLYVPGVKTVTKITFSPTTADLFEKEWQELVQSIELHLPEVKNTNSSATGSILETATKMPCGGSAGILCKTGFYCFITDIKENIGLCTAISK